MVIEIKINAEKVLPHYKFIIITQIKLNTMKRLLNVLTVCFTIILLQSCTAKSGDVTFWQATDSGYGITVVDIEGVTSNITSEYSSAPDCGQAGCAVFNNLEEGTYSYSASDGVAIWSGSVFIDEGCLTLELY